MKITCLAALLGVALLSQPGASAKCGISPTSSTRIVGGTEAHPHEFPWIAYIQSEFVSTMGEPTLYMSCDGSLIDKQWVLTAAHCFGSPKPGYKINRVVVVLGAHNLANKAESRMVLQPEHVSQYFIFMSFYDSKEYFTSCY